MAFGQFFQSISKEIYTAVKNAFTPKYKIQILTLGNNEIEKAGEVQKSITFTPHAEATKAKISSIKIEAYDVQFRFENEQVKLREENKKKDKQESSQKSPHPLNALLSVKIKLTFPSLEKKTEFMLKCSNQMRELFELNEDTNNTYILQTNNIHAVEQLFGSLNRYDTFDMKAIEILTKHLDIGVHYQGQIPDFDKVIIDTQELPQRLEDAKTVAQSEVKNYRTLNQ